MRLKSSIHFAKIATVLLTANLTSGLAYGLTITRGPYLQMGSHNSMIVRWRTDTADTSRVAIGSSPNSLTTYFDQTASPTTEHQVQLSGLNPATTYYYSVGSTTQVISGADTTTFFKTSPLPGSIAPTRIWVIGDAGTGSSGQTAVYNAYKNSTGAAYTDLFVMLGDNAYADGTDAQYQLKLFDKYKPIMKQTPLWTTIGNHDAHSANSATETGPYYDSFTLPRQGEVGGLPSGTEAYYSFNYGNIHFVVLDTEESSKAVGSPMLTWMENDLQAASAMWTIAFFHHPPYTKGSHDSDTTTGLIEVRRNILPILEKYGVDLVLAGHSHAYERSKFLDGHYGLSSTYTDAQFALDAGSGRVDGSGAYTKTTAGAAHDGAVYVVAGSSGQIGGGTLNHPAMYLSLNELGSLILEVNDTTLNAKFLNSTGTVRDYFTVNKTSTTNPPPTTPSGKILGMVWQDSNQNGLREASEIPLANVGVELRSAASGTLITSATTTNAGVYGFGSLSSGSYIIQLVKANYTISPKDQGTSELIDSDIDPVSAQTSVIMLADAQQIANVDAGLYTVVAPPPPPPPSGTTTLNLRKGENGYTGMEDTYVASGIPTRNYGTSASVLADAADGSNGELIALLKWNLAAIPASATITSVKISLQVFNASKGAYDFWEMKAPWASSSATWTSAAPKTNRGSKLGSFIPSTNVRYEVNLGAAGISLVQGWVNGSIANNGLSLSSAASTDGIDVRSSEHGTVSLRPMLIISYTQNP